MSRWSNETWGLRSPVLALLLCACCGGGGGGNRPEGGECSRTAECQTPLVCCPQDHRCARDLGCLEGGVIPYQDGAAGSDADTDTDTGT